MTPLVLAFLVATLAGAVLTPLVIRGAVERNIFDAPPGGRRIHTEPLPRLGGVAVFLAMTAGLLAAGFASLLLGSGAGYSFTFFFAILLGGSIVFVAGLADDLRGLRPGSKFVAQCVAALVLYGYGFSIDAVSFGPTSEFTLGWASLPLTLLWVVGVTNAFNLIDGLDGLAAGIALVALGTTSIVALALGNVEVVLVCAALVGALVGFIRYNFNPARIFLGDSGSLFVGFMLAVLSVHGSMKSATAVMVLVPLFALAIPLLDTGLTILRRWLRGVPLSEADGRHIHHRLLALGLPHRHAVIVLHVAAAILAALGLSLVFSPPPAIVSVAATGGGVALFLLVYGLRRLQYHEFIEAAGVLFSGFGRLRRVIRDQINAQDVAGVLQEAQTLEELSSVLERNSSMFGFLHMAVCRESTPGPRPLVLVNGHAARAWKLDYPVSPHDFVEADDFVLRIWCNPQNGGVPQAAERVATILAPAIESKMLHLGSSPSHSPEKSPSAVSAEEEMEAVQPIAAREGHAALSGRTPTGPWLKVSEQ